MFAEVGRRQTTGAGGTGRSEKAGLAVTEGPLLG